MADERRECAMCAGEGRVYLFKTWFVTDGFRQQRCGVCAGSGRSSYQPPPDWVASAKYVRDLALRGRRDGR